MNLLNILNDRALLLTIVNLGLTLTHIDLIVKIGIGLATLMYLGYKALNEKKKYDEK